MLIKDLPIEIQEIVFKRQAEQGNTRNDRVNLYDDSKSGNFTWYKTIEGDEFWEKINDEDFSEFYEKYPKKEEYITLDDSYIGKLVSLERSGKFYDKVLVTKENDKIYLLNNYHSNADSHSDKSVYKYSLCFTNWDSANLNIKEVKLLSNQSIEEKSSNQSKSLVGRYLKILIDNAYSTTYKKDDYAKIVADNGFTVSCNKTFTFNYDWKSCNVELMPENFVPPTLVVESTNTEFKKGNYIVTLKIKEGFITSCAKNNFCFKQRINCANIEPEIDLCESRSNGNSTLSFNKKQNLLDWRYATLEEIAEYDRLGKPYDVTTLIKKDIETKFKPGDKVKIINRHINNDTGTPPYHKQSGMIAYVCENTDINYSLRSNKNGSGDYYGLLKINNQNYNAFRDSDLELIVEEPEINIYGLEVGDKLPQKVICQWGGQGLNYYGASKKWEKIIDQFINDRTIEHFKIIDEIVAFKVSNTGSVYLKAEGFKEFMDNFDKPEPKFKVGDKIITNDKGWQICKGGENHPEALNYCKSTSLYREIIKEIIWSTYHKVYFYSLSNTGNLYSEDSLELDIETTSKFEIGKWYKYCKLYYQPLPFEKYSVSIDFYEKPKNENQSFKIKTKNSLLDTSIEKVPTITTELKQKSKTIKF